MTRSTHILICGRDAELLRTRGLVLQSAGYRVSCTTEPIRYEDHLETVDLLVVCHTLSAEEREQAISSLANLKPGAKAVCLELNASATGDGVPTLDSFAGPKNMLEGVKRVLNASA